MPSSHSHASIKRAVLREAAGGDATTLFELLQIFLRIAPPMVEAIDMAGRMADFRALEGSSHDLKGTAISAGANELARLAQELETAARAHAADVMDHLPALRTEFAQVLQEAQNYARATEQELAGMHRNR